MPAVIRPVGVDDLELGLEGIPAQPLEVVPHKAEVLHAHGKALRGVPNGDLLVGHPAKALDHRDVGPLARGIGQGLRLFQRGLPALHGVDQVVFDPLELGVGDALQLVQGGAAHQGPRLEGQQLHALGGRIRPLVVLAGQVLHRQQMFGPEGQFFKDLIGRRLRKDHGPGCLEVGRLDVLHIVAQQLAHLFGPDAEHGGQIGPDLLRGHVKAGLFLHINSINHVNLLKFGAGGEPEAPRNTPTLNKQED